MVDIWGEWVTERDSEIVRERVTQADRELDS